jgi:hypothetical protein
VVAAVALGQLEKALEDRLYELLLPPIGHAASLRPRVSGAS